MHTYSVLSMCSAFCENHTHQNWYYTQLNRNEDHNLNQNVRGGRPIGHHTPCTNITRAENPSYQIYQGDPSGEPAAWKNKSQHSRSRLACACISQRITVDYIDYKTILPVWFMFGRANAKNECANQRREKRTGLRIKHGISNELGMKQFAAFALTIWHKMLILRLKFNPVKVTGVMKANEQTEHKTHNLISATQIRD